ncbi:MAG: hypothetical protein KF741_12095 [Ferruginibacter sp.]|nr:hypothetical protein [Bacteroidota bacterium]MBX2919976.1 hypothetical protein [Ferruginibacter sp.]
MVFIIGLYLLVDVLQHKGQARVLFPLQYPVFKINAAEPGNNTLINKDKLWVKAVNTVNRMNLVNKNSSGFECDVYFNMPQNEFEVHHDPGKATGTVLHDLLKHYQQQNLTASVWLDFKNLNNSNALAALNRLLQLRKEYNLKDKILVESSQANLLTAFADSGFFTSYYTPTFNPYKINEAEKKIWADSIASVIKYSKVDALSGYYFQYPYLHHYFPNYKILTWVDTDKYSLVSWLFKNKIAADKAIFISLNP